MSDEFTKLAGEVPTLTLEPMIKAEQVQEKAQETLTALAAEAPAAPVTLEAAPVAAAAAQAQAAPAIPAEQLQKEGTVGDTKFTAEEMAKIEAFSKQIDVTNTEVILQYGSAAQQKLADFSEKALDNVRTQDLGEVGNVLASVVVELQDFDKDEDKGGIFGFFKKKADKLELMKARYDKADANIDKIVEALEDHKMKLIRDTKMFDQMYDKNLAYFKELSMYIAAGKKRLEEVRSTDLAELTRIAQESNLPEDAQAAKDLAAYCDRFEKRIYDLELSRMVSIQTAPQIRLIQDNNTQMVEKIQSTIANTIPLWKNQMVIAMGLSNAQKAAKAQREVADLTNKFLTQNAEALHEASVETAKASERGIVDIETLTKTNAQLINTLEEVLTIQKDGREKRLKAEAEMIQMENTLKKKLLELNR